MHKIIIKYLQSAIRLLPFAFCLLPLFLIGCRLFKSSKPEPAVTVFKKSKYSTPAPPKRELRAVWIATVDNIDWPSRRDLTPDEQRAEFIKIIDFHQRLGINAVFVQIRAAADAFYAKGTEPWSEWLTGKQGQAPEPMYDPTEFMIEECHKRNIEFHAWLNLNRVSHKVSKTLATNNIGKQHPEWVFDYDGYRLFNFGLPEVRQYITDVTTNIVKNYDVDGIHFDDYFYPYTVAGQTIKDAEAYKAYRGRFPNINDWRRNNIDLLIKQIADGIAAEKSYVKFGISPFGVWRNKKDDPTGSDTQGGQTSYDNLYADTKKWMKAGWIDYMVPQIYFTTKFDKVPFKTMTNWWLQNSFGRHLYIGQGAYRVGSQDRDKTWLEESELPNQMRFLRENKGVTGSVFFSSKSLINNKLGHSDSLLRTFYRYTALPPTMPWKDAVPPLPPVNFQANRITEGNELRWAVPNAAQDGDLPYKYVIYRFDTIEENFDDPRNILAVVQKNQTLCLDPSTQKGQKYRYAVRSLDRLGNESLPVFADLQDPNQRKGRFR